MIPIQPVLETKSSSQEIDYKTQSINNDSEVLWSDLQESIDRDPMVLDRKEKESLEQGNIEKPSTSGYLPARPDRLRSSVFSRSHVSISSSESETEQEQKQKSFSMPL